MEDELGGPDERILSPGHRRRARVAGRAGERPPAADVADDPGDDAERGVRAQQRRPLLDVQLHERVGPGGAGPAAGTAALLVAEGDDGEPRQPEPLDRLEPRDDAERAVEAAAAGNGVEVRAGPDLPIPAGHAPDQVSGGVDLDLEPGLAEPAGGELVRSSSSGE